MGVQNLLNSVAEAQVSVADNTGNLCSAQLSSQLYLFDHKLCFAHGLKVVRALWPIR